METITLDRIKQQMAYLERHKDHLVIDADTHPTDTARLPRALRQPYEATPNYYHGRPISREDLLREMAMAQVDMALIWQNPAATQYTDDPNENFDRLLAANRYIYDAAQEYPEKFIPGGWTDPKALGLDNALKMVDHCMQQFGFFIVKMNPAQNAYMIDSPEVFTIVDRIAALGGAPTFHYGADTQYTPPEGLEKIAQRYPDTRIVAVHMGGGGASFAEAEEHALRTRELGLRYPNLFFPISTKRETHIESDLITYQLAGPPFNRNLASASDAPYGRQTWNFGGFRAVLDSLVDSENHTDVRVREQPDQFTEAMAQNLLGVNFADFVLQGYQKYLDRFIQKVNG